MARIRYLKPGFFTDEDLSNFPFETRLTFAGLWCHADKSGRLEDRPKFLKAMIFPYDDVDMEKQLEMLSRLKNNGKPFINRYRTDNLDLIQIVNWDEHQRPHSTETPSKLPPFSKTSIIKDTSVTQQLDNRYLTVRQPHEKGMEKGTGKEKGMEKGNGEGESRGEGEKRKPSLKPSTEEKKELAELCLKVNQKYPAFNSFAWIQKHINAHPSAHLHVLKSLIDNQAKSPWAYADQIISIENGNYNEADHIKTSNELKKSTPTIGDLLQAIPKQ